MFEQCLVLALDDLEAADPTADIDADFSAISGVTTSPEPLRAKSAAMANWMNRPIFLISFFSM